MAGFSYYERGRTRMLSDTINWATTGKIYDEDLIINGHFNVYYGDLFGTGEETIPHYANRSLEYLKETMVINREHVESVKSRGMAYIFYSSSCSFDDRYFTERQIDDMEMKFAKFQYMFGTKHRRWACFNSPEWLNYQVDKTTIIIDELNVDGVFFDNVFYLTSCICWHCQQSFREATGKELLPFIAELPFTESDEKFSMFDGSEPEADIAGESAFLRDALEYAGWRQRCAADFFVRFRQRVDDYIGRYGKTFSVIVNSFIHAAENVQLYKQPGVVDAYFTENGFSYAPKSNVYSYKLARAIERESRKPTIVITRVLEGNPTTSMLKAQLAEGAAFGGAATPWGFYLHDSLDLKLAARHYCRFFEWHEEMLARQSDRAEVAVVQSLGSSLLDKFNGNLKTYFAPAGHVASQMLADLHIPFDILNAEDHLHEAVLGNYKLVVLAEVRFMHAEGVAALQSFLNRGGRIVMSRNCLKATPDLVAQPNPLREYPNATVLDERLHYRYLDDRISGEHGGADGAGADKYPLLRFLASHDPTGFIKINSRSVYTQANVTQSEEEMLVHLVNMNCNRGPYYAKVMPERNIELVLRPDRAIAGIEHLSPDFADPEERKPLAYGYREGAVHIHLPRLDSYSIVRVAYAGEEAPA